MFKPHGVRFEWFDFKFVGMEHAPGLTVAENKTVTAVQERKKLAELHAPLDVCKDQALQKIVARCVPQSVRATLGNKTNGPAVVAVDIGHMLAILRSCICSW